jgi:hypothetical protein
MSTFAEHVEDYLRLRRALRFKLDEHARLLPKFAAHLDAAGAEFGAGAVAIAVMMSRAPLPTAGHRAG